MKKILLILTSVIMITTVFVGCTNTSTNNTTNKNEDSLTSESESENKLKNSTDNTNDASEILKKAGWTATFRFGLGFYAPMSDMTFEEDPMYHDDCVQNTEIGVGSDSECGESILSIYCSDAFQAQGGVFSNDAIEYVFSDLFGNDDVEPTVYKEDDKCIIYHQIFDEYRAVYVFCKNTGRYYRVRIHPGAWTDITTDYKGESKNFKAGYFFDEEKYEAFINTLCYLG